MSELEDKGEEMDIPAAEGLAGEAAEEDGGTVIRDTDIVFDCPHCGHNLAIDYRGAGLPIECVNCGESVLVPIPDGMKIDDLDIEPGEILKQLFAARRNLQRAEMRVEALELELNETVAQRNSLRGLMESLVVGLEEFRGLARNVAKMHDKEFALLDRLAGGISSSAVEAERGGASAAEEEGAASAE